MNVSLDKTPRATSARGSRGLKWMLLSVLVAASGTVALSAWAQPGGGMHHGVRLEIPFQAPAQIAGEIIGIEQRTTAGRADLMPFGLGRAPDGAADKSRGTGDEQFHDFFLRSDVPRAPACSLRSTAAGAASPIRSRLAANAAGFSPRRLPSTSCSAAS